jgi:ABC transporter
MSLVLARGSARVGTSHSCQVALLLRKAMERRQQGPTSYCLLGRGGQPVTDCPSIRLLFTEPCSSCARHVDVAQENVLFGSAYDEARYNEVMRVCALEEDVASLPAGDETELGERGINLSGGQKARLALARAAYSAAEVVLLDDPLSAVDPRVGRILFSECIGPGGFMKGGAGAAVGNRVHS